MEEAEGEAAEPLARWGRQAPAGPLGPLAPMAPQDRRELLAQRAHKEERGPLDPLVLLALLALLAQRAHEEERGPLDRLMKTRLLKRRPTQETGQSCLLNKMVPELLFKSRTSGKALLLAPIFTLMILRLALGEHLPKLAQIGDMSTLKPRQRAGGRRPKICLSK